MHGIEHGWGMGWGWIIIIAVIVLVVWLIIKMVNNRGRTNTGKSSLDILKDRYARGEIDREEFEEKKKDLL